MTYLVVGLLSFIDKTHPCRFFPRDLEVISTLVTFEHLSLMCGNPCVASPPGSSLQTQDQAQPGHDWSHRSVALLRIISIAYY